MSEKNEYESGYNSVVKAANIAMLADRRFANALVTKENYDSTEEKVSKNQKSKKEKLRSRYQRQYTPRSDTQGYRYSY